MMRGIWVASRSSRCSHDHPRYVGCKIGIHNQRGEKVGRVGKVRNTEHFFIAGEGAEMFIEDAESRSVVTAG